MLVLGTKSLNKNTRNQRFIILEGLDWDPWLV